MVRISFERSRSVDIARISYGRRTGDVRLDIVQIPCGYHGTTPSVARILTHELSVRHYVDSLFATFASSPTATAALSKGVTPAHFWIEGTAAVMPAFTFCICILISSKALRFWRIDFAKGAAVGRTFSSASKVPVEFQGNFWFQNYSTPLFCLVLNQSTYLPWAMKSMNPETMWAPDLNFVRSFMGPTGMPNSRSRSAVRVANVLNYPQR